MHSVMKRVYYAQPSLLRTRPNEFGSMTARKDIIIWRPQLYLIELLTIFFNIFAGWKISWKLTVPCYQYGPVGPYYQYGPVNPLFIFTIFCQNYNLQIIMLIQQAQLRHIGMILQGRRWHIDFYVRVIGLNITRITRTEMPDSGLLY